MSTMRRTEVRFDSFEVPHHHVPALVEDKLWNGWLNAWLTLPALRQLDEWAIAEWGVGLFSSGGPLVYEPSTDAIIELYSDGERHRLPTIDEPDGRYFSMNGFTLIEHLDET